MAEISFPSPSTGITIHHSPYPFISAPKFQNTLRGKVVLITGASRGIGYATALAFASAGASIAALARSSAPLQTLVSEVSSKYGTPIVAITGDVLANSAGIVKEVEEKLGKIDILVNNAGVNRLSRFTEEDDAGIGEWWKVFEVNVQAPISLLHACLPTFLSRGSGISITVGSNSAELQIPFMPAYSASKAGILKAIQCLDLQLREKGVLSFLIHPGAVKTDMALGTGGAESEVVGEGMRELLKSFEELFVDEPELSAQSMVALAVLGGEGGDERVKGLSGRYWEVTEDLEGLLDKMEDIVKEDLYKIKIGRL